MSGDLTDPDDPAAPRDLEASDPNAGGADGLTGDMGVSSERTGRVRGTPDEVTHGTEDTSATAETDELPAHDGQATP